MKIIRIIFRFSIVIFALLFCLYLALLAAFPSYFNINAFKAQIQDEFYKQTGLPINIEQLKAEPSLSPYINIYAYHIAVLYPNKKELLKVKDANLKIKVFPILKRKIHIEKIILNRPIISFSINPNGRCSLDEYLQKNMLLQTNIAGFSTENNIPTVEMYRYRIKVYDKRYSSPFIIEGNKLNAEEINSTNCMHLITKGKLSQNGKNYITYDTDIETEIPAISKKLFENNPFGYIKQYNLTAKVIAKIKMKNSFLSGYAYINDLAFKINDQYIDKNYINLKFDNNKIQINADVKTDAKNHMQILGHYEGGKNKNINLDVKTENSDLKTLKSTAETILNALNIKNNISKYNADGKINLNFKIKSNFKTLKSEGNAEIVNANIYSSPYKITNINSKISFANNTITVKPSKMYINTTPVSIEGKIDSKTNLDFTVLGNNLDAEKTEKLFFPKEIKEKFILQGILGFNAKIQGNAKTPKISISSDLKNFKIKEKKKTLITFQQGTLLYTGTIEKPNGEISLHKAIILPEEFDNNLISENIKILITPQYAELPKTQLSFGGAPVFLAGKINDYLSTPQYDFKINGKLSSQALLAHIKKTGIIKNISAAAKGNITINGKLYGNEDNAIIKADFRADSQNYISGLVIKELLNQPSVTTADAVISRNTVNLKELTINKENSNGSLDKIITLNGKIKNINNPILDNLRIIVPKSMTISVSELKNSEITLKSDITLNGKPEQPNIKGNLDVKNIIIPEFKLKSKINEFTFDGNNIKINIPKLEIGKSNFTVNAAAITSSTLIYIKNATLYSDYIDLDEINETFSEYQNDPIYPGIKIPLNIPDGTANIKIFRTGGLQAENINCNFSLINNVLKMKNITGNAYKGTINGKAEYNFLHTSTVSEINGKNADIRPLIKALTGKQDEMSGIIDYKVKISSVGTKRNQQQRTAKGYMEFTARNGVMGPLGQFEHFLYAQNLISQSIIKMTTMQVIKAVRPQNTGLYTIAKGNIEINKGNAYLKPLTVEGPNMSLYMTGKLNALNDHADLRIYGRISQQVEQVLGNLTNPMPKTIMSSSSETSIGNLFYDEYNTTVSKAITDAIPKLNPEIGLSSRLFAVIIQGSPDSVSAVKSFKWITGTTNAPVPTQQERQISPQQQTNTEKINNSEKNTTNPIQQQKTEIQTKTKEQSADFPDFMNNLPDDFN